MSAHTPGPWIVTGGERLKYVEARIGNGMLQEVASCMICEKGDLEANAKLIAAAPENYESNKELAAIVRELCAAYKHPLPEASLNRSDAAIKKAKGGDV